MGGFFGGGGGGSKKGLGHLDMASRIPPPVIAAAPRTPRPATTTGAGSNILTTDAKTKTKASDKLLGD